MDWIVYEIAIDKLIIRKQAVQIPITRKKGSFNTSFTYIFLNAENSSIYITFEYLYEKARGLFKVYEVAGNNNLNVLLGGFESSLAVNSPNALSFKNPDITLIFTLAIYIQKESDNPGHTRVSFLANYSGIEHYFSNKKFNLFLRNCLSYERENIFFGDLMHKNGFFSEAVNRDDNNFEIIIREFFFDEQVKGPSFRYIKSIFVNGYYLKVLDCISRNSESKNLVLISLLKADLLIGIDVLTRENNFDINTTEIAYQVSHNRSYIRFASGQGNVSTLFIVSENVKNMEDVFNWVKNKTVITHGTYIYSH